MEKEGFEPSDGPYDSINRLAICRFRPLSHLSRFVINYDGSILTDNFWLVKRFFASGGGNPSGISILVNFFLILNIKLSLTISSGAPPTVDIKYELVHNEGRLDFNSQIPPNPL